MIATSVSVSPLATSIYTAACDSTDSSYFQYQGVNGNDREDDIYCPSWLLNFKPQSESFNQTSNSLVPARKYLQKNFDEKKIINYRKVLNELIETEITYKNDLSLCLRIYKNLLNCYDYRNILTEKEEYLFFNNLDALITSSEEFISLILNNLSNNSNINLNTNSHTNETWDINNITDISRQIENSSLKFNIGNLLSHFFKNQKYEKAIKSYTSKHELQIKILKMKQKVGSSLIINWLDESKYLCKNKTNSWSLESLLIKPVQRLMKYPLFIKNLLDNYPFNEGNLNNYPLSICLIQVNEMINRVNNAPKVSSLSEVNAHEDSSGVENDNELSDHEYDSLVSINGKNTYIKGCTTQTNTAKSSILSRISKNKGELYQSHEEYIELVIKFKNKYEKLKEFKQSLEAFNSKTIKILQKFSKIAVLWGDLLNDDDSGNRDSIEDERSHGRKPSYITCYTSFIEKIKSQELFTLSMKNRVHQKILNPIDVVLLYCDMIKEKVNKHKKLRSAYVSYIKEKAKNKNCSNSKAQCYIRIENLVMNELPKFLTHIDHLLSICVIEFNKLNLSWLRQILGERSIQEYLKLIGKNSSAVKNMDIIRYYMNTRELNRIALQNKLKEFNDEKMIYFINFYS